MTQSVSRDTLRRYTRQVQRRPEQLRLAALRLRYQELQHPLSNYIRPLLEREDDIIHPRMLPTQSSGRWSTVDPPLTNFAKACINPECPKGWHEKRPECWSVRDCILPIAGHFWIEADLDAIEARIFALKVGDTQAIKAFNTGIDIHTLTACDLFNLPYPQNHFTPHTAEEDTEWRHTVQWRGKDDGRRGISKNFRYGTQYCLNYKAVLDIKDLEQFHLSQATTLSLAKRYWDLTAPQQTAKLERMQQIRKTKVARTLYGSRRVFFDGSDQTAKEGFNFEIQGTVVDYINRCLLTIIRTSPGSYVAHNAHDGFKVSFPLDTYDPDAMLQAVKRITEGSLTLHGHTVNVTATAKIIL